MYVYADQNFLVRCRDSLDAKDVVIPAHRSGKATLVLSPIHFYEIGTVRDDLYESTIQFVEEAQPAWILGRFDLLSQEFKAAWEQFWKRVHSDFSPIGDLAHAASAMHRKPPGSFEGLTPRDFIEPFRDESSLREIRETFGQNRAASDDNRLRQRAGEITAETLRNIEKRYVATQLARLREDEPIQKDIHEKANHLLGSEPWFTRISIFVENVAQARLKAHNVEVLMTSGHWQGQAILKENRQIDREHAVVALAYCDVFVTGDAELRKYCEQASAKSGLVLARVVSPDEWIETLRRLQK